MRTLFFFFFIKYSWLLIKWTIIVNLRACKRRYKISIVCNAGFGKTKWCKIVTYDWASQMIFRLIQHQPSRNLVNSNFFWAKRRNCSKVVVPKASLPREKFIHAFHNSLTLFIVWLFPLRTTFYAESQRKVCKVLGLSKFSPLPLCRAEDGRPICIQSSRTFVS